MKKFRLSISALVVLLVLLSSCSRDDDKVNSSETATLSFAAVLNDLAQKNSMKNHLDEIPECSQDAPAFVDVVLSRNGSAVVGSMEEPLRVNIHPNPSDSDGDGVDNYFTEESTSLELEPGSYSLDHFVVLNAAGEIIWVAPVTGSSMAGLVTNPLPMVFNLGSGVKKYVNVDVLCFDDRMVNRYGYLFFDINGTKAIEFCIFGNFCDQSGRHFPAQFSVDVWKFTGDNNNPQGQVLVAGSHNTAGINSDGDAFADPVCVLLPDSPGTDQYYVEITLMDGDGYDTQERIIRSGVITDEDVRTLFDGNTRNDYYHFREGACNFTDSPALFVDVHLDVIAEGMVSPVGLVPAPDDSQRLFVIDQIGKVWVIDAGGNKLSEPFLDVTGKLVDLMPDYDERGLLGMAFHPDYAVNGRIFVYYTAPPPPGGPEEGASWDNLSRISEFTVSPGNPNSADPGSERVVLEIKQPQFNHEGGTIAFGPDGYLYISIGDGGNKNDIGPGHVPDWYTVNEGGNGQDIEANLLGNILRIDVNGATPYAIPADNPFVGKAGLDEIYAYGFRNPYRFSFDMTDGHRLFVGDAGQKLWEEISVVEKGENYGWNVKEGTHCFNADNNMVVLPTCPEVDIYGNRLIDPVIEMRNHHNPLGGETLVIVGGYVYRGNDIPGLYGQYIFGSFSHSHERPAGEVFVSFPGGPGLWDFVEMDLTDEHDLGYFLKGFGQDLEGEIYLAVSSVMGPTGNTGKILKLVP